MSSTYVECARCPEELRMYVDVAHAQCTARERPHTQRIAAALRTSVEKSLTERLVESVWALGLRSAAERPLVRVRAGEAGPEGSGDAGDAAR